MRAIIFNKLSEQVNFESQLQYGSGGFAKILASQWGNFFCPPQTLSNLRSGFLRDGEFTHRKPAAIPPQNHPVTCRNRGGFNFYRGGRISNCWWRQHDWQLKNFPYTCILLSVRHIRTTNTMIRLRMHRLVRTCAIGGNLHLAGICACFDARAKANFFYVF